MWFFSYFCSKHRSWVHVRTASVIYPCKPHFSYMSRDVRKPVFRVSDQVRRKPGLRNYWIRLEIWKVEDFVIKVSNFSCSYSQGQASSPDYQWLVIIWPPWMIVCSSPLLLELWTHFPVTPLGGELSVWHFTSKLFRFRPLSVKLLY